MLWITGVNAENNAEDATDQLDDEYKITKSLRNISDVGYLTIQVVQATGLGSTKLQGKLTLILVLFTLHSCIGSLPEYSMLF